MFRKLNKPSVTLVMLIAAAVLFLVIRSLNAETVNYPQLPVDELAAEGSLGGLEEHQPSYYLDAQRTYSSLGLKQAQKNSGIVIAAARYSAKSADADIERTHDAEAGGDVMRWTNDTGWVEWELEVQEEGLYEMVIDYWPLEGSFSPVVRGIEIDGAVPFREAASITLDRVWKDDQYPYSRNELGNELRPVQTELTGWRTMAAADYKASSQPLQWHLTKGRHVLRMTGGREPVALGSLRFVAPEQVHSYAQYKDAMSNKQQALAGNSPVSSNESKSIDNQGWAKVFEGEQFAGKSKPGIQTVSLREPHISPDPKGRIVYNAIGGERWRLAGEWVEWEVEVPEDGFYEIVIKYLQSWRGKSNSYRTIMIDGKVPFRELLAYALPSSGNFSLHPLQNNDGIPFRFYLGKGKHVLRMTADASVVEPAALSLKQALSQMAAFDRKLRTITGNFGFGWDAPNMDSNRTWDVELYYPGIKTDLQAMIERLERTAAYLKGVHQAETDTVTAIQIAVETLRTYSRNVDNIPNKLADLTVSQNNLALWLNQLSDQMVMIDALALRTPGADIGLREAGTADYVWYSTVDFFRTFSMQYNEKSLNKEEAVTVWVQRGRDYVDVLNQMIEQYFTPETGIKVNVNLMPNPNALILSNAAGDQPDVVLGVSQEMPADYAMRDAAADLSQFPGFSEVEQRFLPGVMNSYRYNGGTYGIPEIQNFYALYYRTDILQSLGLEPPRTWDDVYRMMPTLQEQGMTFFYPPKEFSVFFLQNKADLYSATGRDSKLGEKKSLEAFTEWTELFDKHLFPLDVPSFIEHFRKGDVPVGIADFSMYVMLNVAAPDITGNWKMAPIPGMPGEDGTVARWAQQPTTGAMIMKNSDNKEDAWTFLKWWTSTEVQSRYGEDVESLYGLEYRWNSANVEALFSMPWPKEELDAMKEQFRWANNIPIVPGHYFLPRVMDFAWNDRVLRGIPTKEALEDGNNSLQREIRRKLEDFGLPEDINLHVPGTPHPNEFNGGTLR